MSYAVLTVIYFLFFLSGAAALVYQVVWVRSLTLVFGGSHLAVTVVLSIFMAGLALGGYAIGKYADRIKRPLLLYGLLELGIGVFALIFIALVHIYPSIYTILAQGRDDSPFYLTLVRILFAAVALIIPTSLMGGTLPVLSRFMSDRPMSLRKHLSFLYGVNTLGAVLGAAVAGFVLLRLYSVSATLYIAVATNLIIGIVSVLLRDSTPQAAEGEESPSAVETPAVEAEPSPAIDDVESLLAQAAEDRFRFTLVIWGIGVSGFCALGYEVLWTRILAVVVGASVYSFTTMLIAFLTGIALGSGAYALWAKLAQAREKDVQRSISGFGIVQIVIGITALLTTVYLRNLPAQVAHLHNYFLGIKTGFFGTWVWSSFLLACSYMFVPAFFMGLAFPMAGRIHAECRKIVGRAVGEVLAYNTVGAILGAAVAGMGLIYLVGIERSLQMLIVVNIGFGLVVLFSRKKTRLVGWSAAAVAVALIVFLGANRTVLRIWDQKYFAVFRSNQLQAFNTPDRIRDAMENTEVLYYAEGSESIVSSIKVKGGEQSFVTSGRVEASSHLQGQQVMFALSHLPMLLHKEPKKALVIGLGAGMSLGAISVHPGLEELVLAELEPKVLGVARTFGAYNHKVLDNPKLKIIFNDGRNFLLTTPKRFDVITADPIHPWFRGAGYLYTSEYFKLAADHLRPGGILCQWLPIYELSLADLKSIVKTFNQHFKYTMLFLTHDDAELIGSNEPILIDEAKLDRRISEPTISEDLRRVMMGSADDMLSYFLMGTSTMKEFAKDGVLNTDENLYLEFSAPFSIGKYQVRGPNVMALLKYQESILPYLVGPADPGAKARQARKWASAQEAQKVFGRALVLFLNERSATPEFGALMDELRNSYPWYAPAKFLRGEYRSEAETEPSLIQNTFLHLASGGKKIIKEISVVLAPASKERAAVVFVDNQEKIIYAQLYFSGPGKEERISRFVSDAMTAIGEEYKKEAAAAVKEKRNFPEAGATLRKIKEVVLLKVKEYEKEAEK
jgi:spermidine synthase